MRCLAVGLVLLFPVELPAQQLGGVSLRLGESQGAVLERLVQYKLTQRSGSIGFWSVSDTTKWKSGLNYGNVGTIQFLSGRLVSVNRAWESTARDGMAAANTIMAALRQLEGNSGCTVVSQRPLPSPEARADLVSVICGDHEIMIGLSDQEGGRYYQINESWLHRNH